MSEHAITGHELKGAGQRYQSCPGGCGRTLDLTKDAVALGNGGWWCRECTDQERQKQFERKEGNQDA